MFVGLDVSPDYLKCNPKNKRKCSFKDDTIWRIINYKLLVKEILLVCSRKMNLIKLRSQRKDDTEATCAKAL